MANDYYMEWLGIGPGLRPPDYYVLLSLPRFVPSPRAAAAAAAAQLAKLDPYAIHPDRDKAAAATAMMNEVAAARAVLTDPVRQAAYDQELARALGLSGVPSPDTPDMSETAVGKTPLATEPPDLSDLAAAEGPAALIPGQEGEDAEAVSAALFAQQAPLQETDPSFVPPHSRRMALPFSLLLLFGALGLALIVAIIVTGIVVFGPDAPPLGLAATPRPALPRPAPATPVEGLEFVDRFDEAELGVAYEIRSGGGPELGVRDGKLLLGAATDTQAVRVDVMPSDENVLFRQATVELRIERGATFGVGIATAAMLSITRSGRGLEVRAAPGRPTPTAGESGWPRLANTEVVSVHLSREEDSVVWRVNGRNVGVSPDMKPRTWPALALTSTGPAGRRVAIDSVHVVYDP